MSGAYPADMAVVDRFGFSGKPEEVRVKSQTADRIPGVPHEFHRNETDFNGRKTVKVETRSRVLAEISLSGKDVGKLLGLLPVNSSSHCSVPSSFQKITGRYDRSHKRLRGETRLPECSPSLSRSQKRTGMVEGPLKNEQWQKHFAPGRTRDNIHGCLQARVGAHLNLEKVGGRWIWVEKVDTHINILELKAAFFALQAFLPQLKQQHIQFGIDNKTAVAYINKLGGTHSHCLTSLALEMWNFVADRKLTLSAVYVLGEENHIADKKSRVFQDSLEWMLHPAVFQALQAVAGCFDIDLFATRVNHQVPAFVSWRPGPGAGYHRCFQCKMGFSSGLSFPPFCMIERCLKKIQQDQSHCVLITPVWKSKLVSSHSVSLGRATMASSKYREIHYNIG